MNSGGKNLNGATILLAMKELGRELGEGHSIEMVIVGGAAGLLGHILPGTITTSDVDAIHFRPPEDVEDVLRAAETVADKQGLSRAWLNIDAGLFSSAMPKDWEARRIHVGAFGRLATYAIGRIDLIAMKFYAHREVDLEHLDKMKITRDELAFTESHLNELLERLPGDKSKIEMAIHILQNWNRTS